MPDLESEESAIKRTNKKRTGIKSNDTRSNA